MRSNRVVEDLYEGECDLRDGGGENGIEIGQSEEDRK